MNFFKAPEVLKRLERAIQLSTDRGQWIRVGTFVAGTALIAAGAYVLLRKPINTVTDAGGKLAVKVAKAVA